MTDSQCFRNAPEFVGYEIPPLAFCVGLPFGGVASFFLITCLGTWVNRYCRRKQERGVSLSFGTREAFLGNDPDADADFVELSTYENLGVTNLSLTSMNPARSKSASTLSFVDQLSARSELQTADESNLNHDSRSQSCLSRCCDCVEICRKTWNVILLSLLGIITFSVIITLLYFPKVPNYSLCKIGSVQWLQMIEDWITWHGVKNSIDFHVSVYNPGHLGLSMKHLESKIFYEDKQIGWGNATDIKLPGGAIVDVLLPTVFQTDTVTAMKMFSLHELGQLFLDFQLHLDGAHLLLFGEAEIGTFSTSAAFSHVDVEAPSNVSYCLPCTT